MDYSMQWGYNPTFMLIVVEKDGALKCSATTNPQAAYNVKLQPGEFAFVTPITSWVINPLEAEKE